MLLVSFDVWNLLDLLNFNEIFSCFLVAVQTKSSIFQMKQSEGVFELHSFMSRIKIFLIIASKSGLQFSTYDNFWILPPVKNIYELVAWDFLFTVLFSELAKAESFNVAEWHWVKYLVDDVFWALWSEFCAFNSFAFNKHHEVYLHIWNLNSKIRCLLCY